MAVKTTANGKWWTPDHLWTRPCIVEECREEHAPTACPLFKAKSPEERLAAVRRKELCTLWYRHLDTKWFGAGRWAKYLSAE
jgi:hypothetical protein